MQIDEVDNFWGKIKIFMYGDYQDMSEYQPKLSRRDFFGVLKDTGKLVIGSLVGYGFARVVGARVAKSNGPSLRTKVSSKEHVKAKVSLAEPTKAETTLAKPNPLESAEYKQMLEEIVKYRQRVGLSGLPKEIIEEAERVGRGEGTIWIDEPPEFENLLPQAIRSYGMYAQRAIEVLLGPNSRRFCRGVKRTDDDYLGFDPRERKALFPKGIAYFSPIVPDEGESDTINYITHEAIGHGTDPLMAYEGEFRVIPFDQLVKIEHGKWRALTQTTNVEGQFLRHPNDAVFKKIELSTGLFMAKAITEGKNLESLLTDTGRKKLEEILEVLARERGVSVSELKYNKRTCRIIGEYFFQGRLSSVQEDFSGELRDLIAGEIEPGLKEIYAEMMKMAIVYPDKIGDNGEVIEGIREVVETIRGERVDLAEVREAIRTPNEEEKQRYRYEREFLAEEKPREELEKVLSPEEVERIKKEIEKRERLEKGFRDFMMKGTFEIPAGADPERYTALSEFARFCKRSVEGYPKLIEAAYMHFSEEFDPNFLHIWEIWHIEETIHMNYIKEVLSRLSEIDKFEGELRARIAVLSQFVNHPQFGK